MVDDSSKSNLFLPPPPRMLEAEAEDEKDAAKGSVRRRGVVEASFICCVCEN